MKRIMIGPITALICQLAFGCSNDNEIDRTFDCGEICAKYSDCVTDIDVTDCTDHCEDQAEANPDIERAADACEDCLDGRSCAEASACIPSCELVPVPS